MLNFIFRGCGVDSGRFRCKRLGLDFVGGGGENITSSMRRAQQWSAATVRTWRGRVRSLRWCWNGWCSDRHRTSRWSGPLWRDWSGTRGRGRPRAHNANVGCVGFSGWRCKNSWGSHSWIFKNSWRRIGVLVSHECGILKIPLQVWRAETMDVSRDWGMILSATRWTLC